MESNAEKTFLQKELGQILRLALADRSDSLRLLLARLIRTYRGSAPDLAELLDQCLRECPPTRPLKRRDPRDPASLLRRLSPPAGQESEAADGSTGSVASGVARVLEEELVPEDGPGSVFNRGTMPEFLGQPTSLERPDGTLPVFARQVQTALEALVQERRTRDLLAGKGPGPTGTLLFAGPAGTGKTTAALWLARQLQLPLCCPDVAMLASLEPVRLVQALFQAREQAEQTPCLLLLDSVELISGASDSGCSAGQGCMPGQWQSLRAALIRILDTWPAASLLVLGTSAPQALGTALQSRFDRMVRFPVPDRAELARIVLAHAGEDRALVEQWQDVLVHLLGGRSCREAATLVSALRRVHAINPARPERVTAFFREQIRERGVCRMGEAGAELSRQAKKDLVVLLAQKGFSNRQLAELLDLHRDTVARYLAADPGTCQTGA